MQQDYLLLYRESDVRKYTGLEQLIYALPGVVIKARYVDPIEAGMIFKICSDITGIRLMKIILEEAGVLRKVELYEYRPLNW